MSEREAKTLLSQLTFDEKVQLMGVLDMIFASRRGGDTDIQQEGGVA